MTVVTPLIFFFFNKYTVCILWLLMSDMSFTHGDDPPDGGRFICLGFVGVTHIHSKSKPFVTEIEVLLWGNVSKMWRKIFKNVRFHRFWDLQLLRLLKIGRIIEIQIEVLLWGNVSKMWRKISKNVRFRKSEIQKLLRLPKREPEIEVLLCGFVFKMSPFQDLPNNPKSMRSNGMIVSCFESGPPGRAGRETAKIDK